MDANNGRPEELLVEYQLHVASCLIHHGERCDRALHALELLIQELGVAEAEVDVAAGDAQQTWQRLHVQVGVSTDRDQEHACLLVPQEKVLGAEQACRRLVLGEGDHVLHLRRLGVLELGRLSDAHLGERRGQRGQLIVLRHLSRVGADSADF